MMARNTRSTEVGWRHSGRFFGNLTKYIPRWSFPSGMYDGKYFSSLLCCLNVGTGHSGYSPRFPYAHERTCSLFKSQVTENIHIRKHRRHLIWNLHCNGFLRGKTPWYNYTCFMDVRVAYPQTWRRFGSLCAFSARLFRLLSKGRLPYFVDLKVVRCSKSEHGIGNTGSFLCARKILLNGSVLNVSST